VSKIFNCMINILRTPVKKLIALKLPELVNVLKIMFKVMSYVLLAAVNVS
jgi:hypothetical protein